MSDDGSGFENRRAPQGALWVRAPLLPLRMRHPMGDGTGSEARPASRPLQVRLLPHPHRATTQRVKGAF